jgi:hypothetical protein
MPTLVVTDDVRALLRDALNAVCPLSSNPELARIYMAGRFYSKADVLAALKLLEDAPAQPVRPFLDLSTVHLQPSTRELWRCTLSEDFPGTTLEGEFGWMVSVPTENTLWGPEWGTELPAIFDAARARGADYVLFDCHADEMEGLPTFGDDEPEDDGCPKGDPECLGNNGDCHDACESPEQHHG